MSVMSNSVKTKFAGMLRGLLHRLEENEAAAPPAPRVLTSTALPSGATPVIVSTSQRTPAAPAAQATPAPAHAAPSVPRENPENLQLPLQPILAAMPMDLRAKVMQAPPADAIISIPLEKILTQLAFGSVKITFGELRQAAPGIFVNSGGEHDSKTVTLPLNEILTRLNPAKLSRRPVQKHLEVADEISGPFGPGAQGVKISANTRPTPSTTLTSRTSAGGNPPLRMVAPAVPVASEPTPVAPPPPAFVPRVVTPTPSVVAPPPPSLTSLDTSHTTNFIAPRSNGNRNGNGLIKPFAPVTPVTPPPAAAAPLPPPAAPLPPAAEPPEPAPSPVESAAITAPLKALSEQWPEGLRLEIIQSNLVNAQVLLPIHLIEPALKRGRITSTWRNLRPLIKPAPPAASIHDGIELELPLSVIAPLFFTRQKTAAKAHATTSPPVDIPNLFFGLPQAESAPPQPPAKTPEPLSVRPQPVRPTPPEPQVIQSQPAQTKLPEPQMPRPVAPEPQIIHPLPEARPIRQVLKPVDNKLADSNYYIWGDESEPPRADETEYINRQRPATDFTSRYATPKEIVERAMNLPGVMGVLVALPDGLRVASQVPPEFNADTLAAFLPQIFDRVSQSTKELRMGALNNFNFTVGNVPWKIFRVNAVYFAAFGCAGEALPSVQLAALAAELDRKKQ